MGGRKRVVGKGVGGWSGGRVEVGEGVGGWSGGRRVEVRSEGGVGRVEVGEEGTESRVGERGDENVVDGNQRNVRM